MSDRDGLEERYDLLRRKLDAEPRNADLLARMGSIAMDLGRPDEARDLLRRAIEVDPKSGYARRKLDEIDRPPARSSGRREAAAPARPEAVPPPESLPPFAVEIGRALLFPLKPRVLPIFLMGAFFFWITLTIPILAGEMAILTAFAGYLVATQLAVLDRAASDPATSLVWPDFQDLRWHAWIGLLTVLATFWPALLALGLLVGHVATPEDMLGSLERAALTAADDAQQRSQQRQWEVEREVSRMEEGDVPPEYYEEGAFAGEYYDGEPGGGAPYGGGPMPPAPWESAPAGNPPAPVAEAPEDNAAPLVEAASEESILLRIVARRGDLPGVFILLILGGLAGGFAYPMGLLLVARSGEATAPFRYAGVARAVAAAGAPYAGLSVLWTAFLAGAAVLQVGLERLEALGIPAPFDTVVRSLVLASIWFYALLVLAFGLGRIARHRGDAIAAAVRG